MKIFVSSLKLFAISLLFFGVGYPFLILGVAKLLPGKGDADYSKLIGQQFSDNRYFWSRPSATGYNAASTGGSNLGPTNPVQLQSLADRRDSILKYHPYLKPQDVPTEWVTASGSGLDPHISYRMAVAQIKRVATARGISELALKQLVDSLRSDAAVGPDGNVHLLTLNQSLNRLK